MAEEDTKPGSRWSWDVKTGRYRDNRNGKFLSQKQVLTIRDDLLAETEQLTADLTEKLLAGDTSLAAWEAEMRATLRSLHLEAYMLGRGGQNAMQDADWTKLANAVQAQDDYLRGFAEAVRDGELSEAQIQVRAVLYPRAARTQFEVGRSSSRNLDLPGYPGVDSECRVNCRCTWIITEYKDRTVASWTLGSAEHCDTCKSRALKWGHLVFDKEGNPAEGQAA